MKLLKLCSFVFILSLSNLLFAAPSTSVGGPEDLSDSCSYRPTPTCPPQRHCPSCSVCPQASQCRVCVRPSITPTPTLPPSDESSPSPSPSPSPTEPQQCKLYQLDFKHLVSPHRKSGTTILDQTKSQDLDCFTELYKKIIPAHDPSKVTTSGIGVTNQLWKALVELVGKDVTADYESNKKFIQCDGRWRSPRADTHNGHMMIGGGQMAGNKGRLTPGCDRGSFVMNDKCELQEQSKVDSELRSCSLSQIKLSAEVSTPISLVWSDSYKTQASTLVSFKLNPHSENSTWLWRGSESLPLLVYDPEHTGVITSAKQLFGSWTFGGNGLASLLEGRDYGTPWKDGYEALSMMDKNFDGKVSGEELRDLSLWFDKNQDGISQVGEVKTLSDVSVTALYYQADTKEAGAIVASRGYERQIDGKTVVSRSMDWYEKSIKDGYDVILDSLNPSKQSHAPKAETSSEYAKDVAPEISGAWSWSLDLPAKGAGMFSFDTSEDGILGVSLTRVGISGVSGFASKVLFSHFEANVSKNSEGKTEVQFVTDGGEGTVLTNTASLSEDGTKLIGKTVVTGSTLSESGTYEYFWKAERVK